jgi:hypothetical protein
MRRRDLLQRLGGGFGASVSEAFARLAGCVDDMAFLLALASRTNVHGPASYLMNTGFLTPGFPCMGAWVSYALGPISRDLPAFVVLPGPKGLPYNARGSFSSGFLPMSHQGTVLDASARAPVPDLFPAPRPAYMTPDAKRDGLALLASRNRKFAEERPGDSRLEARVASYELAARMQLAAPEALEVGRETEATKKLYGLDDEATADFGRRCLLARRLVERDVRFVQVWSGAGGPKNNWDNHADIATELPAIARQVDGPAAALLQDLRARGLLDDTLVVFSTEFGRMPFTQGATGRDHNGGTSIAWLSGAGIKGGAVHGRSDEWSWKALADRTECHDLHATILHLLGIDHERLIVRHDGIDRRLTDVHGRVIRQVLT